LASIFETSHLVINLVSHAATYLEYKRILTASMIILCSGQIWFSSAHSPVRTSLIGVGSGGGAN